MILYRRLIFSIIVATTSMLTCSSTSWASDSIHLFKEFTFGQSMAELREQTTDYEDCSKKVGIPGALCSKQHGSFSASSDWLQVFVGQDDKLVAVSLVRETSKPDIADMASSLMKSGYTLVKIDAGVRTNFDLFETINKLQIKDVAGQITGVEKSMLAQSPVHIGYVFFNISVDDVRSTNAQNLSSFVQRARQDLGSAELRCVQQDDRFLVTLTFRSVQHQHRQRLLNNAGTKREF